MVQDARHRVLLTGATGYVGGRLAPLLADSGCRVRCLARKPHNLRGRLSRDIEIVQGDVLDRTSLDEAMSGIDTAYYLVHSLGAGASFEKQEQLGARNFAEAARRAGVKRIIYLGGLGCGEDLSPHLASRQEVGRILREHGPQTIELRAAVILGSGSVSFEMIRALVEKLPVMITPRWTRTLTQPIAVEDVLEYLHAALDLDADDHRVFEIGGPSPVSYGDLMLEYARQRGLRRRLLPAPVLSPRISSLWLGLVTPLYARVGRKLIEGLRNETTVRDDAALSAFSIRPRDYRQALARALVNEDHRFAATRWSDALSVPGPARSYGGVRFGSRLVDSRSRRVDCSTDAAFNAISRIGGKTGWYYGDRLWRLRGFLDLLVGGVGMRRGRRHPERVVVGDAIDFWRVEAVVPGRLLRLQAEMKLPGRAWLQFEVTSDPDRMQGAVIRQTASFDPIGLAGLVYWYALWPVHQFVFEGLLRNIARAAEYRHGEAVPA